MTKHRGFILWLCFSIAAVVLAGCTQRSLRDGSLIATAPSGLSTLASTVSPKKLPKPSITLPPPPTLSPTVSPTPLPAALQSFQFVFAADQTIDIWQEGAISMLVEYEGEPQYMDYQSVINTLPVDLSDDGALIAFIQRDGSIWTIRPDGTDRKVLFDMETLGNPFDIRPYLIGWLPGTHNLLFSKIFWFQTGIYGREGVLYIADADTGEVKEITVFESTSANFTSSPDGKHIAAVNWEEFVILDSSGDTIRKFSGFPNPKFDVQPYTAGYFPQPAWAADSQSFAVVIPPSDPYETGRQTEIWRYYIDGREPTRETQIIAAVHPYHKPEMLTWLAPNLEHVVYVKPNDHDSFELHLAKLDLSQDVILLKEEVTGVNWSPDSRQYIFSGGGENPVYWVGDIAGNLRPLEQIIPIDEVWIDPERLIVYRHDGFWLVTIQGEEYLLAEKEFYQPIQYFQEFDIYIGEK